jgi:hypothetical protein
MMEALSSSEMSVLTRATWLHIPEDIVLHIHRYENLRSYMGIIRTQVRIITTTATSSSYDHIQFLTIRLVY